MLPAKRTTPAHNVALDAVLTRLVGTRTERADTPDGWVTAVRRQPAVPAVFAPFPDGVDARLREVLAARGIEQLYTHQADGDRACPGGPSRGGHDADRLGQDALLQRAGAERHPAGPVQRARCISSRPRRWRRTSWPSCTSCRDRAVAAHASELEIGVFTYDGDTPQDARRAIRGRAHVVLSNPDMLHSGILPHHPRWAKLFENLRYVVIDELHAYRGVFGSHLTNVLRRLRRICRHYGSNPDVHLLVGDDRQPARAGRGAGRAAVRAGVGERRAARREGLPVRQPAGGQPAARHPAVVSGGNAAHRRASS